jgi:uncharacterized membrane protein YgcG
MSENKTKFEKLLDFFSFKPLNNDVINRDTVITAQSQEEFDTKVREIEQNYLFRNVFKSLVAEDYIRYTQIEAERRIALLDFQLMEYYPMISNAFDIIAEEATSKGMNGKLLNVYSNNPKIKKELETLFYKTLSIDNTLYRWCRNMVSLGDNFLYLMLDNQKGITGVKQLQTDKITRIEKFNFEENRNEIVFHNEQTGSEFNNIMIAHFRLLSTESRFPYGTSVAEKLRKIHKLLLLAEDAVMINRLTRINRLKFEIEVGNIAPNDRQTHAMRVAQAIKQKKQVSQDGTMSGRYNVLNQTQDYFITSVNGTPEVKIDKIDGDMKVDVPDIELLINQLVSGLGIPRSLLMYDEPKGDGKNLSMLDSRFAKKIMRIQECLVAELNKIASIHLYLKGYAQEVDNFKLTLANSSVISELSKLEIQEKRLQVYASAIAVNESTQLSPMSETMAKREILNMTDDEIINDVKTQFVERAVGEEFRQNFAKVGKLGIFDDIIERYKKPEDQQNKEGEESDMSTGGGGSVGGGGGGGGSDFFSSGGGSEGGGDNPFLDEPSGGAEGGGEGGGEVDLGGEAETTTPEETTPEAAEEPEKNEAVRRFYKLAGIKKMITENKMSNIKTNNRLIILENRIKKLSKSDIFNKPI